MYPNQNSDLRAFRAENDSYADEGPNALDYIRILRNGWKWIALSSAVFGLAALIYALSAPDVYQASTQIMVEKVERQERVAESKELVLPSWSVEEDYFGTQIAFLTSTKVLMEAMAEAGLDGGARILVSNNRDSRWVGGPAGGAGGVYKVQAKRQVKTRLISLSVSGSDAAACFRLANAIGGVYLRENAVQNLFISKQMFKWLEEGDGGTEPLDPARREALTDSLRTITEDPELIKLRTEKENILNQLRELSLRYRPAHPRIKELSHSLGSINDSVRTRREILIEHVKDSLAGDLNITNVRVLDPAVEPSGPSGPDRLGLLLRGLLGGAAAGAVLVILIEMMNQKVRTDKDLPSTASTPYLGSIPRVRTLENADSKDPLKAPGYVDLLENDMELRDAVIGIRTHILFSTTYEKTKRVMFVNTTASEGRSTVATLIGLSLASMGRKILLIEADLRSPSIGRSLGMGDGKGLTDFLRGEVTLEEVVRTVPGSSLDVIVAGSLTNRSSELLASSRFDRALDALGARYDRILLIAPPILTNPDALIIAKNVSCGILVCSAGVTDLESVRETERKFVIMKRPLVGVVINRLNRKDSVFGASGPKHGKWMNRHIGIKPFPGSIPRPDAEPTAVRPVKSN
jgi:capsular exopolysaccharide synthesis family protein